MASSKRWIEVSASPYEWERDALAFIRELWPDQDAYRVWTNFEFIDHDGSINEVDLLAFSPRGAFLVEIKSWPDRTEGDGISWVRHRPNGSRRGIDNPLLLANRKAKRLKSLIEEQMRKAGIGPKRVPFLSPLVFLSHPDVRVDLNGPGRTGVCLRDSEGGSPTRGFPGIVQALTKITDEDKGRRSYRAWSSKDAEVFADAIRGIGIRETSKHKKAGDWELGELLEEGQGWQEFSATHGAVSDVAARIRIFGAGSQLDRELVSAAARREFRTLEPIDHPGILAPREYVESDQGPALVYDPEPNAVTLDRYLDASGATLTIEQRLSIVRQIAEAVAYAHSRDLMHRALSPRSIIVRDPDAAEIEVRVRDWHVAHRLQTATAPTGTLTAHVDLLLDQSADVYLAPEHGRSKDGVHIDVFSLGAIAFRIFSGHPPAKSLIERQARLTRDGGLDLAAVVDGARELQRAWISEATSPRVDKRTPTVKAFLGALSDVEADMLRSESAESEDPTTAIAGETLAGYTVVERLGRGGTAIAYLVATEDDEAVLKVASSREHNKRLREEGEVISSVAANGVVRLLGGNIEVQGHAALLLEFAGPDTLADRLRADGPPGIELLQRWGVDLLGALAALEQQGVSHRDIKPDNIGIRKQPPDNQLRLTLFDFSLSRSSPDAISAGTPPYLDPFMKLPDRGRWDLSADRFSLAVTLYEMATGHVPRWGDGESDPAVLGVEATVEEDLLEPSVADPLSRFFAKAVARSAKERFDSAAEMLEAWSESFVGTETVHPTHEDPASRADALDRVTLATRVGELPISARARSALRGIPISTVADLLSTSAFDLRSIRGVGAETRDEIIDVFRALEARLQVDEAPDVQALDLLAKQLVPSKGWNSDADKAVLEEFLGFSGSPWRSTGEIANQLDRTRDDVEAIVDRGRERWAKSLPSVTRLRDEIAEQLESDGDFTTAGLLEEAVEVSRGAVVQGAERRNLAAAATRAALEAESRRESPRFAMARLADLVVISAPNRVAPGEAVAYLEALATQAEAVVGDEPVASERVADSLRTAPAPNELELSAERLARLVDSTSELVAANARGDLYRRGLSARIAVERSAGALAIGADMSIEEIRSRVTSRYPRAEKLPGRPGLDALLDGLGLDWDATISKYRPAESAFSTTRYSHGSTTELGAIPADEFEQRLRSSKDRFLALTARSRWAAKAEGKLEMVGNVTRLPADAALIHHMKEFASSKGADWEAIVKLDEQGPGGTNWSTLLRVARDGADRLVDELLATDGTVLLSRLGLLERYGCLDILDHVRSQIDDTSSDSKLDGLWVLVPVGSKDQRPVVDKTPIPVLDENEWAHVPSEWVRS